MLSRSLCLRRKIEMFHHTAEISDDVSIGSHVSIWRYSIVQNEVEIGDNTIVGSHVYIGAGVRIGSNCKIQNGAQIFEGSIVGNGVFIGPGAILTNDKNPRAVTDDGKLKSRVDWDLSHVEVCSFASIGAGAICVAPVKIGEWALIGAGSVVTKSLGCFEFGFGNPYERQGWIGRAGKKLVKIESSNYWSCPISNRLYEEIRIGDQLRLRERD
jgi:UDP-2-acetamido-3-amino-2,3-dideoxy-glucuronate N-acetyltransferase